MNITYIGPDEGRVIAATGQAVRRGETVDVPDDIAEALCEQTDQWSTASEESE